MNCPSLVQFSFFPLCVVFFFVCAFLVLLYKIDFFHELEGIIATQHRAIQCATTSNVPIICVQKIALTKLPPPQPHSMVIETPNLSIVKEVDDEEVEYSVKPWHRYPSRRHRNLLDLVVSCELQFERYVGDWLQDEYFVKLDNAYLVSGKK